MAFGLLALSLVLIFSSLSECHFWSRTFEYNYIPNANEFFQPKSHHHMPSFPHYPELILHDQNIYLLHQSLLYQTIIENQLRAFSIISEVQNALPFDLQKFRSSCHKRLPKEVFFADYPHTKALLQLQWKRLGILNTHKLGSLRMNSPFYRA